MPLAEPPVAAGSLGEVAAVPLAGRTLHRMWRGRGPDGQVRPDPWWFASASPTAAGGRFDLAPPMGTCYLATSRVGAALEALQEMLVCLPSPEMEARVMADIHLDGGAPTAADLTAQDMAGGLGITAAMWAGPDRTLTQRWAAAFRRDGWWALHVGLQHDPAGSLRGVALFDHAGEHAPTHDGGRTVSVSDPASDEALLADLEDTFGVIVRAPGELPFVGPEGL